MTEHELEVAVVEVAHLFGWRVAHFRPARTAEGWRTPVGYDGAGFPDLVLVGRGRVVFRELKVGRGKLSAEQEVWLEELSAAGVDAGVWTDNDWRFGVVESELQRLKT